MIYMDGEGELFIIRNEKFDGRVEVQACDESGYPTESVTFWTRKGRLFPYMPTITSA